MSLHVRPIAGGDIEAVVRLWKAAGLIVPHNDPYEDIRICRASPNAEILIGFDAQELAAAIMVGHDGHCGWYYYMGASPGKQMGELGRQIMSVAENWLQERGVGKAQLMLRPGNAKVKDFYTRLGYSEENRIVMAKRFRAVPDWQIGRTETMVLHLEMMARPHRSPAQPPAIGKRITLEPLAIPSVQFYRFLYDGVGADWTWLDRRLMDDDTLRHALARDGAEYYLLQVNGEPAGFCELERNEDNEEVELAYFGLLPGFIGCGIGRYFIDAAIDLAWRSETKRVTVHTCDLDHPRALGTYQRAGFVPYAREIESLPDPRRAGLPLPLPLSERGHAPTSLFLDQKAAENLPLINRTKS